MMNNYLMWWFVIPGVIFALYASAEGNVERLHSEEFKILLKKLEEKDQRIQSLEDRLQEREVTMRNVEDRLQEREVTMRNFEDRLQEREVTMRNFADPG